MRFIQSIICFFTSLILRADEVDLYLIAGQSNADGRAQTKFLSEKLKTSSDSIKLFINGKWHKLQPGLNNDLNNKWFGPEITFGQTLQKYYPKREIALVKYAVGSTTLGNQWHAPDAVGVEAGSCYKKFVKAVKDASATFPPTTKVRIKGMIWMQGETDSWFKDPAMANAYEKNLTVFLSSTRKEFNLPDMPIVIGRISKSWIWSGGGHGEIVRKAQDKVAKQTPHTILINTDDLPLEKDCAHYNTDGQKILGKRFADALVNLITTIKRSQPEK